MSYGTADQADFYRSFFRVPDGREPGRSTS